MAYCFIFAAVQVGGLDDDFLPGRDVGPSKEVIRLQPLYQHRVRQRKRGPLTRPASLQSSFSSGRLQARA